MRYAVIGRQESIELCGFAGARDFQHAHRQWVEKALENKLTADARWSEALAVGSLAFVEKVKSELGIKAVHRAVEDAGVTSVLRERSEPYRGEEFLLFFARGKP